MLFCGDRGCSLINVLAYGWLTLLCTMSVITQSYIIEEYMYRPPNHDTHYGNRDAEMKLQIPSLVPPPPPHLAHHYDAYPMRGFRDSFLDEGDFLADESVYTTVRARPDPSYTSFVRVQLPSEGDSPVQIKYVSKCNNTIFMNNIEDSAKFQQCFLMAEKLLCSGESVERTYRLMLGDTLYKHCYPFMNFESLQVDTVKQLHQDKTKVEVYCENSIPVTRCQCSNYLIEQERRYNTEKRFLSDKVNKLATDFDGCRVAREAFAIANESAVLERDRRESRIESLTGDLKMCEEEKDKEQVAHILSGAMLTNCTKLTSNLQKESDDCNGNLTICRKSLNMCMSNITDGKQKRQQEYNECDATKMELEKKLIDSMPHDAPSCDRVDIPLPLRKFLKVVLQRGYTQQVRLFGINPELQSSSYLSKYGSLQQFTPAVPIIPPRHLLVSICGEHCAELRRKRVPTEPLLTTKYTFSDPSALLNTRRYRTATGLSLEVSGTVHVWEQRFPLDTEQFHVGMYKSKRTQFFALREEGKNFEYCACPMYEKDFLAEAQDFIENMSQVDKALVSGEFKERKTEDPRHYWQRTQPSGGGGQYRTYPQSQRQLYQQQQQQQQQQHKQSVYMDPNTQMQHDSPGINGNLDHQQQRRGNYYANSPYRSRQRQYQPPYASPYRASYRIP